MKEQNNQTKRELMDEFMNDLFDSILNSEGSEEFKSVVRLMKLETKTRRIMFNVVKKVIEVPDRTDYDDVFELTVKLTQFKECIEEFALSRNIKY